MKQLVLELLVVCCVGVIYLLCLIIKFLCASIFIGSSMGDDNSMGDSPGGQWPLFLLKKNKNHYTYPMSVKKVKRYVVRKWKQPGVYTSWKQCQAQVRGFPAARFKSFTSKQDAHQAFELWYVQGSSTKLFVQELIRNWVIGKESICVDAACKWNPWNLERRCVRTSDQKELFRSKLYYEWTVNIGEYLALLRWMKWLIDNKKHTWTIYSDSRTAMAWVRKGKHNSMLSRTNNNIELKHALEQWELWFHKVKPDINIVKWNTKEWWEIPADFGRK